MDQPPPEDAHTTPLPPAADPPHPGDAYGPYWPDAPYGPHAADGPDGPEGPDRPEGPHGPDGTSRPGALRRNRLPLLIGAAVLVLAGGGTAWAIAASHDSTPSAASTSTSPAPTGTPTAPNAKAKAKHPLTSGTIASESGSTWTLRTLDGRTVTVTISDQTQFGTAKAPAQKAEFTVGSKVSVVGTVHDTTVTAKRVRAGEPAKKATK